MANVLVIDDEAVVRRLLNRLISRAGHTVIEKADGAAGLKALSESSIDLVISDICMPGVDGMGVLKQARKVRPDVPVIMITGQGALDTAVEALRAGALDYVEKPFNPEYVLHRVTQALERSSMAREIRELRRAIASGSQHGGLLGRSEPMQALFEMLARVARTDAPVLVHGETGTGKELVAREIHRRSARTDRAFVAVNCAALAESILESELFGYRKGAFTGAASDRAGFFEAADGGTLLLDEIGEMPTALQVKLLRVLQEGEVMPVGSTKARAVDVRVIAATNRDLDAEVEEGRFREDLYYRLNVLTIDVPALRVRMDDVPLLSQYFLDEITSRNESGPKRFGTAAMQKLLSYRWPGNVRELQNAVLHAAALSDSEEVEVAALPTKIRTTRTATRDLEEHYPTLEEMERRYIVRVLERTQGNKSEAASILGIDRSTLYRKIKHYGIVA